MLILMDFQFPCTFSSSCAHNVYAVVTTPEAIFIFDDLEDSKATLLSLWCEEMDGDVTTLSANTPSWKNTG